MSFGGITVLQLKLLFVIRSYIENIFLEEVIIM